MCAVCNMKHCDISSGNEKKSDNENVKMAFFSLQTLPTSTPINNISGVVTLNSLTKSKFTKHCVRNIKDY